MSAANNKDTAIAFLRKASSGKLDEAYNLVSRDFRHHNPHFKGDADSLKAAMADAHKQFPGTKLEVQRVIAEGDLVAVHSKVQHAPEKQPIAVVHIFRFSGDQIAELWDVGIEVPKDSPNNNGAF